MHFYYLLIFLPGCYFGLTSLTSNGLIDLDWQWKNPEPNAAFIDSSVDNGVSVIMHTVH